MSSYTTVDLVESYLGLEISSTSTPSESTVERYIEWVSGEIDHVTKNQYGLETITEIIDINSDNGSTSANTSDVTGSIYLPYSMDLIALSKKSVQEIEAVWYNEALPSETPSWVAKTVGFGGQAVLNGNYLELIDPQDKPRIGAGSIKVTYTYGKQVIPSFVEKLATRMVALEIMSGQQSSSLTQGTGRIRVGDIEIDDPGMFSSNFIKQTEDSITKYMGLLGIQNYYLI
jgi:hypothetical protein